MRKVGFLDTKESSYESSNDACLWNVFVVSNGDTAFTEAVRISREVVAVEDVQMQYQYPSKLNGSDNFESFKDALIDPPCAKQPYFLVYGQPGSGMSQLLSCLV